MRWVLGLVVGLALGALAGAWSARRELRALRARAETLRSERDQAERRKVGADLAMLARLSQVRDECARERTAAAAAMAAAAAPAGTAFPPAVPPTPAADAGVAAPDAAPARSGPAFDRDAELARLSERARLTEGQRDEIRRIAATLQRRVEESLGEVIARTALSGLGERPPRPRPAIEAAAEMFQLYLEADDHLIALLDADQRAALEETRFDILTQLDFAALERSFTDLAPPPPATPDPAP